MPPKPKPTALKLVQGNPGRRPLNKKEPKLAPATFRAPEYLSPDAKKEWRRVVNQMKTSGMITDLDLTALAAYCQVYADWVLAVRARNRIAASDPSGGGIMVKTTNGNLVQNPLIGACNKTVLVLIRLAAELGITPSARSRIQAIENDQEDELDKFFR